MNNQNFPFEQFFFQTNKTKLDPNFPPNLQSSDFWTKEEIMNNFGSFQNYYKNNIILTFYFQFGGYLGVIENFDRVVSSIKHISTGKKIYIISFINGI